MNPREQAAYDKAKSELDMLYRDAADVRAEFKQLIAEMAAQIMAEGQA